MRLVAALFAPLVLCALGCEPEIGGPCDPDAEKVSGAVEQTRGTNNLVQDVSLDNCSQGFCLSTDGSRPYCTKQCTADAECAEAGEGFLCLADVVTFGPLACQNYEDPLAPRPDTEPSGTACEATSDCPAGESCFPAGALQGTCGVPGRDCLTGNDEGTAKSEVPFSYCAAPPDVIAERDRQFGRDVTNVE